MLGINCAGRLTASTAPYIRAAGYEFAGRYLVPPGKYTKAITAGEAQIITAAGLKILSVFETSAERAKSGAFAGVIDGQTAFDCAADISMPDGAAIYFAVDYDAPETDARLLTSYFNAAKAQLNGRYRIGAYGSYRTMTMLSDVCDCLWQCASWSGGRRYAPINVYQSALGKNAAGISVDINECGDMRSAGIWDYSYADEDAPLSNALRYKTLDDIPQCLRAEARELLDSGALRGRGGKEGLDITEDMLRSAIIAKRYADVKSGRRGRQTAKTKHTP